MNKYRLNNKEIIVKVAQPKDRYYGRVYVPRLSYNERDRGRGGLRFNNIGTPYIHSSNVVPNIIGAQIVPVNTSQPSNPTYMGSNHSVSGYNMPQSGIPMQMPYGAPPPFLMMQVCQIYFYI